MTPITKEDIARLRRNASSASKAAAWSPIAGASGDVEADDLPATLRSVHSAMFESLRTTTTPRKCLDGQVLENPHGKYFLSERFYPNHKLHGTFEISRLAETPGEWLEGVSKGDIPAHDPGRWVFLDTETTGLAGGTGTCAFLIGVGTIEPDGFRVRLFFMRDYDEEAAMLYGRWRSSCSGTTCWSPTTARATTRR